MAAPSILPLPEPLRLPRGSVRFGIAFLVAATFGYLLTRDGVAGTVLVNAVIVVLAFYYGSGALLRGPTPTATAEGRGRRLVVRAVFLAGFLGLAGWFLRTNPSFGALPPQLREALQILGGYVVGLSMSWAIHHRALDNPWRRRLAVAFRDVSAAGALGVTAIACFAFATGQPGLLAGRSEDALSLIVTYYFGSRVIAR